MCVAVSHLLPTCIVNKECKQLHTLYIHIYVLLYTNVQQTQHTLLASTNFAYLILLASTHFAYLILLASTNFAYIILVASTNFAYLIFLNSTNFAYLILVASTILHILF